jgi:hypothetical protein
MARYFATIDIEVGMHYSTSMKTETDMTAFSRIDAHLITGGVRRGELTIFTAGRGTGKTVYYSDSTRPRTPHDVVQMGSSDAPND